ncbi:MAG: isoprenylcysteine carboxylmethyltransferase family protein [Gammaproteobacteria bacterium]|jgi:protein-S-isoprenylcysteine O-methyltransferase Ste14
MSLNPPRLYQGCILAMVVIYVLLPSTRLVFFPANLLGLPVFLGGAWLAVVAKRQFQKSRTPLSVNATSETLHTSGVYRLSRNPMYLGITIGLSGLALLLSAWPNLLFPVLFILVMDRFFVQQEEKSLQEHFGQSYRDYQRQVRRWI